MKNYRRFLMELRDQLRQAVEEAEEAGWHHEVDDRVIFQLYLRLITWTTELEERCAYYDAIQRSTTRTGRIPKSTQTR